MPEHEKLVLCYNRGCGQKYDLNKNDKDDCQHHPGQPFFHDAYKGWSCCNKKCTDFTEFLNIKGCTFGKHSNVKPPEPEKQAISNELDNEIIEVKAPAKIVPSTLVRPPFDTPLIQLEPSIAESLKQQAQSFSTGKIDDDGVIAIGTSCKNSGCNASYEGVHSNELDCVYHPGVPIFHEGLKYWSCCQKRSTDFNAFLNQPGCEHGKHKWKKDSQAAGTVKCRWDWHQTPDYVIISIYAKQYHPTKSYIKVNPIRMNARVVFPQDGNGAFEIDLELRGIIDTGKSTASMLGTKVEIKLAKMEPGSWSKLDFPREKAISHNEPITKVTESKVEEPDDLVDLSDIAPVSSIQRVNLNEN